MQVVAKQSNRLLLERSSISIALGNSKQSRELIRALHRRIHRLSNNLSFVQVSTNELITKANNYEKFIAVFKGKNGTGSITKNLGYNIGFAAMVVNEKTGWEPFDTVNFNAALNFVNEKIEITEAFTIDDESTILTNPSYKSLNDPYNIKTSTVFWLSRKFKTAFPKIVSSIIADRKEKFFKALKSDNYVEAGKYLTELNRLGNYENYFLNPKHTNAGGDQVYATTVHQHIQNALNLAHADLNPSIEIRSNYYSIGRINALTTNKPGKLRELLDLIVSGDQKALKTVYNYLKQDIINNLHTRS